MDLSLTDTSPYTDPPAPPTCPIPTTKVGSEDLPLRRLFVTHPGHLDEEESVLTNPHPTRTPNHRPNGIGAGGDGGEVRS